MNVMLAATPDANSYVASLIQAYQGAGCTVLCGEGNFYFSNFRPDVLHLQWLENLLLWQDFGLGTQLADRFRRRLDWFRQQGVKIVYTAHNLCPHDRPQDEFRDAYEMVVRNCDVIVHHGRRSIELLDEQYRVPDSVRQIVCRHGDYRMDYREIPRDEARRTLGIPADKYVLLSLGAVRAYKGSDFLASVFRALPLKDKYLLVAGRLAGRWLRPRRLRARMVNSLSSSRKYLLKQLSREELQLALSAADVVLLTHQRGLNTGTIPLAATFGRPVVYPDIGNFSEQAKGWCGYAYPVGDRAAAVAALTACHRDGACTGFSREQWLQDNSWDAHVAGILDGISHLKQGETHNGPRGGQPSGDSRERGQT